MELLSRDHMSKVRHFVWYRMLPFMRERFLLDRKHNMKIETYSKLFSYWIFFVTLSIGGFMAVCTDSYVPVVMTAFLATVSFVVSDFFDAQRKEEMRKKCVADHLAAREGDI